MKKKKKAPTLNNKRLYLVPGQIQLLHQLGKAHLRAVLGQLDERQDAHLAHQRRVVEAWGNTLYFRFV